MKKIILIILPIIVLLTSIRLDAQKINPFISQDSITLGDQFSLWIQGDSDPSIFRWLSDSKELGGFEIIERGDLIGRGETKKEGFEQKITLQAWEEGMQWIPQMSYIVGQDSFITDSMLVPVYPMPIDTTQEIALKEEKGLIDAPFEFQELYVYKYWALGFLALALLIFIYLRFFKKEKVIEEIVILPHEWALNELALLKRDSLLEKDKLKEYYTRISYIIRAYLERRYDIHALEKTTREIMRSPIKTMIDHEELIRLKRGLETTDLVKYAKFTPDNEQHEAAWQKIYDFVVLTKIVNDNPEAE